MILQSHSWAYIWRKLQFKKKHAGGPSRWWRSKTWRSPSSPQIHQKYIYMQNNSYRTPTEFWKKTSDFPKGVSQSPVISCCFNPILSGWEQRPEGNLQAEVGPKSKLNPRSCVNKKEKGKFLHGAQEHRIKSPQST